MGWKKTLMAETDYQATNDYVVWTCLMIDYAISAKEQSTTDKAFLKLFAKNGFKITDPKTVIDVYHTNLDQVIRKQKSWLEEVGKIAYARKHIKQIVGTHGGKWLLR